MGRGILFGAFWGFLVGGLVLAVASLLGDVPVSQVAQRKAPDTKVVEVPAGSEFDQAGLDRPLRAPATEAPVDVTGTAPLVTAPVAPAAPLLENTVTSPAGVPETETGAPAGLAPPPDGAPDAGVTLRAEVPALEETAPALSGTAPAADDSALADTTAAAPLPRAPEVVNVPETAEDVSEAPEEESGAMAAATPVEETPAQMAADATEDAETTETPDDAPLVEETPAAEAPTEPEVTQEAGAESAPAPPAVEADTDLAMESVASAAPRPTVSAGGFGNRAEGVVVNRPTQGAAAAAAEDPGDATTDDAAEAAPEDDRAIMRHAARGDWEPDDRPLFSIVLIDETASAARLPALASFAGPLTFAVPAGQPGAAEAMAAYRAAGHEVALLADIPAGATASDVEVSMEAYLASVPEAVAVMDGTFAGFRGDRAVAQQVAEIAAGTGHGLLTFPQGLGTAAQVARQTGVPVAEVLRDLDSEGQGNTIIRRFLDQAAFRAGQDGHAVLVGRLRAETISALLIWHQQDRAERVNLAPLSATILAASGS
ncbi:MAG: divergent polysaccharide deacetylase family protein [Pseudomonadota bacterium]